MNFIRNSLANSSLRRQRSNIDSRGQIQQISVTRQTDFQVACLETYQRHWQQLEETISNKTNKNESDDSVLFVISHLEHIISLVCNEFDRCKDFEDVFSPCLNHFLNNHVIAKVVSWSLNAHQSDELSIGIVSGLDSLLASAKKNGKDLDLLRHASIHKPVCDVLEYYNSSNHQKVPPKMETILVSLSYYICVLITREPSFLDLFYNLASQDHHPRFPLMTLLVNNMHHRGPQGQTARDSLKLLMALAKEQQLLSVFTLESDFCPIVAGGLCAVFSDLPRVLPASVEKEGMFSSADIIQLAEVENFVTTLEFCDSILETAPSLVACQLLEFCYSGFLLPVFTSALFQDATGLNVKLLDSAVHVNTMKEILASTCYLTLCLRRISNRAFIGIFVRFILTHTFEDICILDSLISRLSAQTDLRLATLQLFNALVDLNCEDVMLALTMKHLLPGSHVMLSQRSNSVQARDVNCLWAAKLLSLVPTACSSRSFRKHENGVSDRESRESGGSSSRIRSWSKNSDDFGESRYGQLAFIAEENNAEQIMMGERRTFSADYIRLCHYLKDNRAQIFRCGNATANWRYLYNGQNPAIPGSSQKLNRNEAECTLEVRRADELAVESDIQGENLHKESTEATDFRTSDVTEIYTYCMEQLTNCLSEMNLASPGQSSGYESFNFQTRSHDYLQEDQSYFSKDVQEALEFWSMMRDDEDEDDGTILEPNKVESKADEEFNVPPSTPSVGSFLEILVRSVDGWLNNSIEVNLSLCSLLSRLACYPHPLLRSFLLNPYLILQPSVPCLTVSIATLKQRIDSALSVNENSALLIDEARSKLSAMLILPTNNNEPAPSLGVVKRTPSLFSVLYSSLSRKVSDPKERDSRMDPTGTSLNSSSNRRRTESLQGGLASDPIGGHVALCAVLLEEWLHELAAMCMEHAVSVKPITVPITILSN